MDPMTIAAVGMAVSGVVQLFNSEKARGAEKGRLNELEKLYESLVPPEYDLSIQDPPELHTEALKRPDFNWDLSHLTPAQFKQVAKYTPEVAPLIAEAAPQVINKTDDMKAGRTAQLSALKKFMSVGAGEFDPEHQQAVTTASRQAQAEAQSRQQSMLQDFARRGQSGSGLNLAAQMGGASQAMDRNAMANMQAASQSYRNQLDSLARGASLGSQIQGEDMSLQSRNADIINSFNQRMAAGRQNWENNRAGTLNDAQRYNIGVEQSLDNANVQAGNDFGRYKQGRQDDLAKWGYDRDVADRNYGNDVAWKRSTWQAGERDRINELKRLGYQDQVSKQGLKAGISNQQGQNSLSGASDRNSAVQGLANAGAVYFGGQAANNSAKAGQLGADDRAYFEKNGSFMSPEQRKQREGYYSDYY